MKLVRDILETYGLNIGFLGHLDSIPRGAHVCLGQRFDGARERHTYTLHRCDHADLEKICNDRYRRFSRFNPDAYIFVMGANEFRGNPKIIHEQLAESALKLPGVLAETIYLHHKGSFSAGGGRSLLVVAGDVLSFLRQPEFACFGSEPAAELIAIIEEDITGRRAEREAMVEQVRTNALDRARDIWNMQKPVI